MEIRPLRIEDAETYKNIRLEALRLHPENFGASFEEEKDYSVEQYKERLANEDVITFGAFENSELVGTVTLVKQKRNKFKHKAEIVAMYVIPEKRGNGFAKMLLKTAIEQAKRTQGIEQINLTVVSTNVSAKRLYDSLGFEQFGVEKRALKLGQAYFDEIHMVLFL